MSIGDVTDEERLIGFSHAELVASSWKAGHSVIGHDGAVGRPQGLSRLPSFLFNSKKEYPMNLRKGVWVVAALFAAYAVLYWYYVIAAAMPFAAQFS